MSQFIYRNTRDKCYLLSPERGLHIVHGHLEPMTLEQLMEHYITIKKMNANLRATNASLELQLRKKLVSST
jgi:hypothetical protein